MSEGNDFNLEVEAAMDMAEQHYMDRENSNSLESGYATSIRYRLVRDNQPTDYRSGDYYAYMRADKGDGFDWVIVDLRDEEDGGIAEPIGYASNYDEAIEKIAVMLEEEMLGSMQKRDEKKPEIIRRMAEWVNSSPRDMTEGVKTAVAFMEEGYEGDDAITLELLDGLTWEPFKARTYNHITGEVREELYEGVTVIGRFCAVRFGLASYKMQVSPQMSMSITEANNFAKEVRAMHAILKYLRNDVWTYMKMQRLFDDGYRKD